MSIRFRRSAWLPLLALLGSVFAACGDPPPKKDPVRPVRAMKVGDVSAIEGRSFPGKAAPSESVVLSFRVSGPLIERPADVGSHVKKGQRIARIDPRDFEVALAQVRARLETAQADLRQLLAGERAEKVRALENQVRAAVAEQKNAADEEKRNKQLLDGKVISQSEYDRHKLRLEIAGEQLKAVREDLEAAQVARPELIDAKRAEIRSLQAAVTHAEDELSDTELKAPYDGEISAMLVENFQTVQAKQVICRLVDSSRIEFTIHVPELLISIVGRVENLNVRFDAFPDVVLPATIKHVRGEATRSTRTYPVTLIMDQPAGARILPGMAGEAGGAVAAPEDDSDEHQVPVGAVVSDENDARYVWVIDESTKTVRRQAVTPGRVTSMGLRVKGLSAGTWVVVAGAHSLREGQKVRILDAMKDGALR